LTDSQFLQELVGKIVSAQTAKEQVPVPATQVQPRYVVLLTGAVSEALRVLGRNGTEVIDAMIEQRHGLRREDVAYRPGAYMSAMKDILDTGAQVLEKVMLEEIERQTGIRELSMEDAVFTLRRLYGR
jgi:hypothetical protein